MTAGIGLQHRVPQLEIVGWFALLAAVTVAMMPIRDRLNEAHVTLAYLLVVQGASARGGRPLGMSLGVVAFICFDWFFLPPYGTFALFDPFNWLVLFGFLATSLISAQLLYRARSEAATTLGLQESHRAKDAVLASVSHDLRTPLTTIKALAHQLADTGDERATIIEQESDRMNRFVADILDLSRISSGLHLDIQTNEAEDLLGAAAQRVAGSLEGRKLDIRLDPVEPVLIGRFDFAQTLRALVNLLENAIKYSPADSIVELAAAREGDTLCFTVADRGRGVPEEERERVFEPFYRRRDAQPDVGGAGLGLSIARGLAEAQGGSLDYSARKGGGSIFTLRLPAALTISLSRTPQS